MDQFIVTSSPINNYCGMEAVGVGGHKIESQIGQWTQNCI